MQKLSTKILKKYKFFIGISILLFPLALWAQLTAKVNYNLADYLPQTSPSTKAIHQLKEEFGSGIPNLYILLPPSPPHEVLSQKKQLEQFPFIEELLWLDNAYDPTKPLAIADQNLLNHFYRRKQARLIATVSTENALSYLAKLRTFMPEGTAFSGPFVDLAVAQESTVSEVRQIFLFILPVSLLILIFATKSYLEPLLLLLTILFGVCCNVITNLFLSEISFITNAVASILQMAVSMDYAIFFLHTYHEKQTKEANVQTALLQTMPEAGKAVLASSLTTIMGFLALLFMQFGIGSDLGFVLAKGVFFSLLAVLTFLPALIICTHKWLEKTRHRSFLPRFKRLSKITFHLRLPILILVILLLFPAFLAQRHNTFRYNMENQDPAKPAFQDNERMHDLYGNSQQLAILVPRKNTEKEIQLTEELEQLLLTGEIKQLISYQSQVGKAIPADALPSDKIKIFISPKFSRLLLETSLGTQTEESFRLVRKLRSILNRYYPPEEYFLAGEMVSIFDMKATVERDIRLVNGLAILSIGLVILLTFRSFLLSFLLLLTIEVSIWLNLAFPYFQHTNLSFIGFLVISTVQLGATVDYGILFIQVYLEKRRNLEPKKAILSTVEETLPSLLPPAFILISAGSTLYHVSSLSVVNELGLILSRGAIFSLFFVLTFLPALLYYLDFFLRLHPLFKSSFGGQK